jgi:hypothetical protein
MRVLPFCCDRLNSQIHLGSDPASILVLAVGAHVWNEHHIVEYWIGKFRPRCGRARSDSRRFLAEKHFRKLWRP